MAAGGVHERVKIQETTLEQYLILNLLYAVRRIAARYPPEMRFFKISGGVSRDKNVLQRIFTKAIIH